MNYKINRLRIKVCGMRERENIARLVDLPIDYIGFIFYPGSPRYAGQKIEKSILNLIPSSIQKVGVFVNADENEITKYTGENDLEIVQLHGNETPEFCDRLSEKGYTIIKTFGADNYLSEKLSAFRFSCNYYLFDTPTSKYGGSGRKFDWNVLTKEKIYLPFFLSGGISPDDVDLIKNLKIEGIHAIDLNSKFELKPGLKNIESIKDFINKLN
jgi:phosphoribosylanthranilate isomerase